MKFKIQDITKSPSNKEAIIDSTICCVFCLMCFSIPACSFIPVLNIFTWAFTIISLLLMVIKIVFFNKKIVFDFFAVCFVIFFITIIISSLLNGFVNFNLTPILMIISTFIVYSFLTNNKYLVSLFIKMVYFAIILFSMLFLISNFRSLIHADFNRLGSEFGNINDIAIFFGLGNVIALYYLFFCYKIALKIINALFLLLFIYFGLSTGAKIIVFSLLVCSIVFVFLFFGKRKWYISVIIVVVFIGLCILLLSLPVFATIKTRLLSMLSTLFGIETKDSAPIDYSSIDRLYMFLNGIEMMARKPLFGYGYHGFHNFSSFGYAWSHNNFSEILCCYGLIGFIAHFSPFVVSLLQLPKKINQSKNNLLYVIILLFFFVCMFSFAFDVQKIYTFVIPVIYCSLKNEETAKIKSFIIDFNRSLFKKL